MRREHEAWWATRIPTLITALIVVIGCLCVAAFTTIVLLALRIISATPAVGMFVSELSALGVLLTAFGAFATIQQMRKEEAERRRPWVLVDFPATSKGAIYFVVQNVGQGLARNVLVWFDTSPIDYKGRKLAELKFVQNPIPILLSQERRVHVLQTTTPAGMYKEGIPKQFVATVSYEGDHGFREPGQSFPFQFENLTELTLPRATVEERLDEIKEQLKDLVTAVGNVRPGLEDE